MDQAGTTTVPVRRRVVHLAAGQVLQVAVAADLLAAFHFEVSAESVGAVNALVLSVLMLLTRGQVTPNIRGQADPGWERL